MRTISNSAVDSALRSLRGESATGGGTAGGNATTGKSLKTIGKGAMSLVGKYSMPAARATLSAGLGATGAMVGFATGVAQGDVSSALQGALIGGTAGKGVGDRIGHGIDLSGVRKTMDEIEDTWNEGAYGAEYAQHAKEIREFKEGSTYQSLKGTYGDAFTDEKLSAMLQAGIKDKRDMEKVITSQNTSDAIGYYTLAKKCPDSIYYDDDKLQMYLEDLGLSQTDAKTMRKNMREFR